MTLIFLAAALANLSYSLSAFPLTLLQGASERQLHKINYSPCLFHDLVGFILKLFLIEYSQASWKTNLINGNILILSSNSIGTSSDQPLRGTIHE
jgi:hypothetical protein